MTKLPSYRNQSIDLLCKSFDLFLCEDNFGVQGFKRGFIYFQRRFQNPVEHLKVDLFAKIVNGFQLLTIFAKGFILDVQLGSEYVSNLYLNEILQHVQS